MLSIFIALCFSVEPIVGGWKSIPVDDEHIQSEPVQKYLNNNMAKLFPEFSNGGFEIASAKLQIVSGYNLKLIIKAKTSPLMLELSLYINIQNKITLQKIQRPIGSKPVPGGYSWQNPSHFTAQDLSQIVLLIRQNVDLLLTNQGEVLVYRTKIEKGLKTHVVFRDSNKNVFSAITIKDPNTNSEKFVSAEQIF